MMSAVSQEIKLCLTKYTNMQMYPFCIGGLNIQQSIVQVIITFFEVPLRFRYRKTSGRSINFPKNHKMENFETNSVKVFFYSNTHNKTLICPEILKAMSFICTLCNSVIDKRTLNICIWIEYCIKVKHVSTECRYINK